VAADALSSKTEHGLKTMINLQPNILRDLENMGIKLVLTRYIERLLSALEVQPFIIEKIKASQKVDAKLEKLRFNVAQGLLL